MAKRPPKPPSEPVAPAAASPVRPVEIIIPASTEYVRVARLAVTGVASRMNFTYEDIEDIKLAVSEACNNAILHAQPSAQADTHLPAIRLTVTAHADRLEIGVTDEGASSAAGLKKAAERAAARRAETELPESGFGLLLIESLMDQIEHRADGKRGTTLRMTKYLSRHGNAKGLG